LNLFGRSFERRFIFGDFWDLLSLIFFFIFALLMPPSWHSWGFCFEANSVGELAKLTSLIPSRSLFITFVPFCSLSPVFLLRLILFHWVCYLEGFLINYDLSLLWLSQVQWGSLPLLLSYPLNKLLYFCLSLRRISFKRAECT